MSLRSFARPALGIFVGLLIGWLVLAITVDRIFAFTAPKLALRWNPGSSDANTSMADQLLQDNPSAVDTAAIHASGIRAIQRQPVAPAAARLLGLAAAISHDLARADRLMTYAEAMSRRDLPTELFLIERYVGRSDVSGALLHYDRAMRTIPESWTILFPVLNGAAEKPEIWRPLLTFLARRPPWARPFLEQFVPQSHSAAALFAIAQRTGLDGSSSLDPAMLQAIERRLVDLGAFHAALLLDDRAHNVRPGNDRLLHNGGFEQPSGGTPFDWTLVDEPDLSAERQPSPVIGGGSALFLSATNGRNGDVATQVVLLPPGRYRMTALLGAITGEPLAFPQFVIRCAVDTRELLHQSLPTAPAEGRMWQADFVVPPDCPAERIVLQARSPLNQQDNVPWIDNIAITSQGRH